MMFSWTVFLIVLAVGVAQLAVGVVFGRFLPLRSAPPAPAHLPDLQARLATAEERLQSQAAEIESHAVAARTDPLTRLSNRRVFEEELDWRLAERGRNGTGFALVLIDLDHFKQLNDTHGHLAGDQALRAVAEVIRGLLREGELAARVGGEEFALILPEGNPGAAQQRAETVRAALAVQRFSVGGANRTLLLRLTASIGLALADGRDSYAALVRRADEALYAAKHSGRNCVFFHDGRRCRRVERAAHDESRLDALCGDLRQRVAEVVAQPVAQP
jgi:diguanylate cyclase (GGDEF)-like protein